MRSSKVVEIRNISKFFDGKPALQNIHLTIEKNEFLVLVGPSGCGKSTLLKIISGLIKQDAGEILINGIPANELSPGLRNISMVFQDLALYPHMTVEENMVFASKMTKKNPKIIQDKLEILIDLLKLESLRNRKPNQISGGEKQRVALGRAMMKEPQIYLMDEPLSSLDAQLKDNLSRELANIHKSIPSTIVYVTHDQNEAMMLASRIGVMHDGRITQIGSVDDVFNDPQNLFVATFFGTPKMNIGTASIRKGFVYFAGTNIGSLKHLGLEGYRGRQILIGMRPNQLIFHSEKKSNNNQIDVFLKNQINLGNNSLLFFDIKTKPSKLLEKYFGIDDIFNRSTEFTEFVLTVANSKPFKLGSKITLDLKATPKFFFDIKTGLRI